MHAALFIISIGLLLHEALTVPTLTAHAAEQQRTVRSGLKSVVEKYRYYRNLKLFFATQIKLF